MDTPGSLDLNLLVPIIVLGAVQAAQTEKIPRNTGLPGDQYLDELLNSSPKRIYDVLQMKRETFDKICKWIEANNQVHLVRRASITIREQVAMFL